MNSPKEMMEQIIDSALKQGAQGAEVIFSKGQSLTLKAQDGHLDQQKISSSQVIGVRILKDERIGVAYSEVLAPNELDTMVSMSLDNAKFTTADSANEISSQEIQTFEEKEEKIFQNDMTSIEEKINFALELESACLKKDKRAQSCPYNGFGEGESHTYLLNHHGVYRSHRERSFSAYTSLLLNDGKNQAMHHASCPGRTFGELDLSTMVTKVHEFAQDQLSATSLQTGKYDIVFTPDTLSEILGCFTFPFSAENVLENRSGLKDKLGKKIAHPEFSIVDTARPPQGLPYQSFDSEGAMKKDLDLIKDGVLQSYYHNSFTAKKLKQANTFHASRSSKGNLGVSPDCWMIRAGSENNPLHGRYLNIISMQGLHSGTNAISGDFSLAVSGYLCEDGKVISSFKESTLSGNFFSLLNQIECIGKTVQADSSRSFFTPLIRFSKLDIAG